MAKGRDAGMMLSLLCRTSRLAPVVALLVSVVPTIAQQVDQRSYVEYVTPSVTLQRSDGHKVPLAGLLDGSHPVVLEFFYTSCSTICGLQASALALTRKKLDPATIFVSITLDPEYDTPARLAAYGSNFPVGPHWYLLTGRRADIQQVLTAFDARPFGDNKMLHRPLVFIRPARGRQWVRIEGLTNSDQIAREVRDAVAHPPPAMSFLASAREKLNLMMSD